MPFHVIFASAMHCFLQIFREIAHARVILEQVIFLPKAAASTIWSELVIVFSGMLLA